MIAPYGGGLMVILVALAMISAGSFAGYGYQTLTGAEPRAEYDRYGLPTVRKLVGTLQLLGAAGLISGLVFSPVGALAAAGLALMMALGLVVRVRIHDSVRLMLPAASLCAMNCLLFALFAAS